MDDFSNGLYLPVSYKGNRQYIQSSDLYIAVTAVAREYLDPRSWVCSLSFRSLIPAGCTLFFSPPQTWEIEGGAASCVVWTSDSVIKGVIVSTGEPVVERVSYAENRINESAVVQGNAIVQRNRAGFTAVEEAVSLTKYLHNVALPLDRGRWIFSGIELEQPFHTDDSSCFSIFIVQNLAGRLTVCEVHQGGELLGRIKFIVDPQ